MVEDDSKSNENDKETVMHFYAQVLKDNRFINISVHGGDDIEESRSFYGDVVS